MTGSLEELYCAEQIKIPVTLPNILKLYAKAAIRTQPRDLLRWTTSYFRALAQGQHPPIKERFEYLPFTHPTGITPGYLRTLLNQFDRSSSSSSPSSTCDRRNSERKVAFKTLFQRWQGIGLTVDLLYQILMIGRLLHTHHHKDIDLYRFLAVACGLMGNNLRETLILICELLTNEPEGGSSMIPLRTMLSLYGYLARLDCSGKSPMETSPEITSESFSSQDSLLLSPSIPKVSKAIFTFETKDKLDSNSTDNSEFIPERTVANRGESLDDYDGKARSEDSARLSVQVNKMSTTEVFGNYDENGEGENRNVPSLQEVIQTTHRDDNEQTTSSVDIIISVDNKSTVKSRENEDKLKEENGTNIVESRETLDYENSVEATETESVATKSQVVDGDENEADKMEDITEQIPSITVEVLTDDEKNNITEMVENSEKSLEGFCECSDNNSIVSSISQSIIENVDETISTKSSSIVSITLKNFMTINQFTGHCSRNVNYNVPGIGAIVSDERITRVGLWFAECAQRQQDLVGTCNLRHFLCPDLQD